MWLHSFKVSLVLRTGRRFQAADGRVAPRPPVGDFSGGGRTNLPPLERREPISAATRELSLYYMNETRRQLPQNTVNQSNASC